MTPKRLNILLLFDLPFSPPKDDDYTQLLRGEDWKDERDVIRTLRRLGHWVKPLGLYDDIAPLISEVTRLKPDLVFNQCESFATDRAKEPNIIGLLELLGIPYTGAGLEALTLCKDKGLSKKLLTYHAIRVPRFEVSYRSRPRRSVGDFTFPGLCKPLAFEASEGLAQTSLVTSEKECLERLSYIHERLGSDAIVEEYIEGRELYVGVLGNERLAVLPPQELFFKKSPENLPRFLTYKAKWDEAYRKRYGIDSNKARFIEPEVLSTLQETCKKIYRLFKITGYARIDLRMTAAGEVVFIEANPNPSIHRRDDFAWSARQAGLSYEDLITRILSLGLTKAS